MKKFMGWTGIVLGGLIGLTLLAGLVLYPIGMKKLTQTYPNIAVETVNIPTDADAVARGKHIAIIWACTKCHGADLSGTLITNDPIEGSIPILGTIPASNLTSGKGGIARSYTDTDWIRAIRHGVMPDGQVEIFMYDYSIMSDKDLGDLIAYLKQIPPVDTNYPEMRFGTILPIAPAIGIFTPAAELINHDAQRPADPVPGATREYGRYLSVICAGCHGNSVARKLDKWNQDDFIRTIHSGVLPDGRKLGPTMSSKTFSEMNDMELTALWLFFMDAKP
jgi:mono/diheme cytochrome c family protein